MLVFAAVPLAAQDTTQVEQGVRIGVEYSGVRPGLVVLPGAGLDSARALVRRDLDYTDRFEMIGGDFGSTDAGAATGDYHRFSCERGIDCRKHVCQAQE